MYKHDKFMTGAGGMQSACTFSELKHQCASSFMLFFIFYILRETLICNTLRHNKSLKLFSVPDDLKSISQSIYAN